MATRSLNVVISGDARQLGTAVNQADAHMKKVEGSSGRMRKALTVGFAGAAAGAGLLVVGLKQTIDAAIEAEKSQAKLKAQLNASGISYRAHAKEIENVIQKHSQLAAVDDEDLQDAFTGLVRSTGSVKASMRDLGLVTDLARAKNLSLVKAADLLGKVHAGNVGVLKRYGISFQPVTSAQDKLRESTKHATAEQVKAAKAADSTATSQKALALLQKRFGGQAEAYGKTAAGAQDRFRVAVENLKEMLGAALLPTVTKVTNAVSRFVVQMQDGTGAGGGFARTLKDVNETLKPVASSTASVVRWFGRHKTATDVLVASMLPFIGAAKTVVRVLKAIEDAANAVVKAVNSVGHALSSAADTAKGVVGSLNPFGDGAGKMPIPNVPNFGGGLMGARPSMAPFAAAGARFGLHVSSGRRPGSITSSGNVSYHSSGEAIDVAGSPSGMLAFFRQMKSKYGSRLAELIHTPGGQGVKDGHPYTYGGQVARDHYDHVHVAYDTGVPGVGDGLGKFVATAYGPPWGGIQGTGTTATGVDLHGAPHRYGVAVDPSVIPLGSRVKITPNPFNYNGAFEAFDTGGAIKGKRIDFYDWRGRKAQLGWGTKTVSVSSVTGGGSSSSSRAKSKSGSVTAKLGGDADPAAIYATPDFTDPQQRIATRLAGGKVPGIPGELLGPTAMKGRTGDQSSGVGSEGDPNQALIDSNAALQAAIDAQVEAEKAHTAALNAVKDELKAGRDLATSAQSTSNFQLSKYLAEVLSGQIGRGIISRGFTPGSGTEFAY